MLRKFKTLIRELLILKCDVIFLQATHVACNAYAKVFEHKWPGKFLWPFGTGRSAGVCLLFSPNFPGKISRIILDSDGHVLIQLGDASFNLVNIYVLNTVSDLKIFFKRLHNYFLSRSDFNCVDNPLDKFHTSDIHVTDKKSL